LYVCRLILGCMVIFADIGVRGQKKFDHHYYRQTVLLKDICESVEQFYSSEVNRLLSGQVIPGFYATRRFIIVSIRDCH
jgi:hypothetical protein